MKLAESLAQLRGGSGPVCRQQLPPGDRPVADHREPGKICNRASSRNRATSQPVGHGDFENSVLFGAVLSNSGNDTARQAVEDVGPVPDEAGPANVDSRDAPCFAEHVECREFFKNSHEPTSSGPSALPAKSRTNSRTSGDATCRSAARCSPANSSRMRCECRADASARAVRPTGTAAPGSPASSRRVASRIRENVLDRGYASLCSRTAASRRSAARPGSRSSTANGVSARAVTPWCSASS